MHEVGFDVEPRSRLGANRASKGSRHLVRGVPRMFLTNDLLQGRE